jgi:FAD-dependent halogenase
MVTEDFSRIAADVVVIGGGPAGATAAGLLAGAGLKVVLFERERFPRYQLGESLMVSTVHGICQLLGVGPNLLRAGFVRKPGGVFGWGSSDELWALPFTQAGHLAEEGSNYAYHVERARFDALLLDRARTLGAMVNEGWRVEKIVRDSDGRIAEVFAVGDKQSVICSCAFVINAGGQNSGLDAGLGSKVFSNFFKNVGISGYYHDADRLDAPFEGGGISEAFDDGWLWFLPLSAGLTSVGAVVDGDAFSRGQQPDQLLADAVSRSRHVRRLVTGATQVREGMYGQVRTRGDYSYLREKMAGDGLFLCGDAAAFLDPLFTTGVHLATYSALLAVRSILSIRDGMDETVCVAEFEHRYRLEYELFHTYVLALYDMHRHDSPFWRNRKVAASADRKNPAFVSCLTGGRDTPESYYDAKLGIGARAQHYADLVGAEPDIGKRAAISREMAMDLHASFQPPSGNRPFHLGFEELRRLVWGRDDGVAPYVSAEGISATADGLRWREVA